MVARPTDPGTREQRQLAMLHAISRSLSGAASVPEAIAEIADLARELLDFDRVAVILKENDDTLRVHAVVNFAAWTEGRLLTREISSPRLWCDLTHFDLIRDTHTELDPAYSMDKEIIERGTRSVLRVPLPSREGSLGMLAFSHGEPDRFHEEDVQIASAIAGLIAMAISHERMLKREVSRQSRLAALETVLPEIAKAREHEEIITTLHRLTKTLIPHIAVGIAVLHSNGGRMMGVGPLGVLNFELPLDVLEFQIKAVFPLGYVRVRKIEILDVAAKRVKLDMARGDQEFVTETVVPEPIFSAMLATKAGAQLRVAIRQGGKPMGVLIFNMNQPDFYTEEDAALAVRLAEQISLTLAQERLESEQKRTLAASERALALEARVAELQRELEQARGPHAVVGVSKSWQEILAQATRVAPLETTVLLTGESGTGKEVVARFLHHASKRNEGPFVAINCAALPEQLLEAELFGHEKGAFTGASATRIGRIEQAQAGVLFLDEVGEMSPTVQAKFLRVLQEREFQRLGSARVQKADVRIVAATNRDLKAMIATGDFREDLYYRLHVFAIHLPPLRARAEDVLALAEHFLGELAPQLGRGSVGMTAEARDVLRRYAWPGNARELRNVIERALILSDGGLIHPEHLAVTVSAPERATAPALAGVAAATTREAEDGPVATAAFDGLAPGPLPEDGVDLEAIERTLVERAMQQSAGNKSKAAKLLGLTRAQLYSRLEKHSL